MRVQNKQSRVNFTAEQLEARLLLAGVTPLISELMVLENNTLADEDGQFSAWLEVHNPTPTPVDLDGWFLTDNAADLDQWKFPAVDLSAGDYLVVFASGKDRAVPGNQLHTNFQLNAAGEYLALVKPDAVTVAWQFTPQFPSQLSNLSFGSSGVSESQTLLAPGSAARTLVPTQAGDLDPDWAQRTFDDQLAVGWIDRETGIGFDVSGTSNVGPLVDADGDIQSQMFNRNSSAFVRIPFQVDNSQAITDLDLTINYDDGYVAYLNGLEVARQNAPVGLPTFDATATVELSDQTLSVHDGLVLWLDAQDLNNDGGSTNPSNGSAVSRWQDKSSSNNELVDIGESLPEYAVGVQNGRNAVRFSGPDAIGDLSPQSLPTGNANRSVFFVGTPTANNHSGAVYSTINSYLQWGDNSSSSTWNNYFIFDHPANDQYFNYLAGNSNDFFSPTSTHDIQGTGPWDARIIEFEYDAPNGTFWNDGTLDHTGTKNNSASWDTVLGALRVGKEPNTASDWDMFEILVYDRDLTDAERNAVGFYLSNKYGLATNYLGDGGGSSSAGLDQVDLSSHFNSLVSGKNVLAIQGLNVQNSDQDFLIRPQLHGQITTIDSNQIGFLAFPTPGGPNSQSFESNLPVISEFMAFNDSKLTDQNGDRSDWIEIKNTSSDSFDLEGWYLTDSANNLTKWQFPAVTMKPGEHLIVFASRKNRTSPAGQLHTNFSLDGNGEFLALVFPDGETVVSSFSPKFPQQFSDVSFGSIENMTGVTTLVAPGDAASVLVPTQANQLDSNWNGATFDQAMSPGWFQRTIGVGYDTTGSSPAAALIDHQGDIQAQMLNRNPSAFIRNEFQVSDPGSLVSLQLEIDYTDAYVAYLNGNEVARHNAPAGPLGFNSTAASDLGTSTGAESLPVTGGLRLWLDAQDVNDDGGGANPSHGAAVSSWSDKSNSGNEVVDIGETLPEYAVGVQNGMNAVRFSGLDTLGDTSPAGLPAGASPRTVFFVGIPNSNSHSLHPHVNTYLNYGTSTSTRWHNMFIYDPDDDNRYVNYFAGHSNDFQASNNEPHDVISAPGDPTIIEFGYDGGTAAVFYNNGGLDQAGDFPAPLNTDLANLRIGREPGTGSDWDMFEMLVYDRELDSTERNSIGAYLANKYAISTTYSGSAVNVGHEVVDLTDNLEFLVPGKNVLAIQGMNATTNEVDFLIRPQLTASTSLSNQVSWYITQPTPGTANTSVSDDIGPFVTSMSHAPNIPTDQDDITVTATVSQKFNPVDSVTLHYRVMYQAEKSMAMFDDGLHGDGVAGDDIWGATIPANASSPGQMVRYYVTARDVASHTSRWPLFENASKSPKYHGTVIADPATNSQLPTIKWFTQNPSAAQSVGGTRASLFHNGDFYDNVFVRVRGSAGQRGNRSLPNLKFDFNRGYDYQFSPDHPRVTEININSPRWDKSYIREILAFETFANAGVAAPISFLVRMEQNGQFFAVGDFVEQVDEDFLRRHGLDPNGAMYKSTRHNLEYGQTGDPFPKKTRSWESSESDLNALIEGIRPTTSNRSRYLFDNVNVPQVINWMAAGVVLNDYDRQIHNFYVYRDSDGNHEWSVFPWDKDLTFGTSFSPDAFPGDYLWTDDDVWGSGSPSHPFNGDSSHRWLGGSDFEYNRMIDAMLDSPPIKEMFLRRLRSLMDELLQPSSTPMAERKFEERLDELHAAVSADVALDMAKYGVPYGANRTFQQILNDIKVNYFDRRRVHLYETHNVNAVGTPDRAGIPNQQAGNPLINFGTVNLDGSEGEGEIVFNPISGNQDEEYISLINPNTFAVDVSGWKLSGGVDFTFQPGVVIPAGGTLYVSPDVNAFRARTTGPSGGQSLFVQGGYAGHLSNFGETIQLLATDNAVVSSVTTPAVLSDAQKFLRISELHYNPQGMDDTEYIELTNISTGAEATTLDLSGARLSDGPSEPFTFAPGTMLAPGNFLLVVKDQAAFQAAYPSVAAGIILGDFQGSLSNNGENIKVDDPQGSTILEFTYNDNDPWPVRADGNGASLQLIDASSTPVDQFGKFYHWQGSTEFGGSPGVPGTASLGVVINEVLARTDPPVVESDSIELHNTTSVEVDIGGWYLSDSSANYLKYQIPAGTKLPAAGYLVFDESHFNPNPLNPAVNDFALSGSSGDDIWLTISNGSEDLLSFVDDVHFGASPNGESFGRVPGGSRLVPLQSTTLGSANSAPRVGPLVFSELNYNPGIPSSDALTIDPTLSDNDLEFLEIFNPTSSSVDLTDWRIRGGVDFDFPAGVTIGAGQVLVIISFDPLSLDNASRIAAFGAHYGLGSEVTLLGPYENQLGNSDDRIELQRPDSPLPESPLTIPRLQEDEVLYDDRAPWDSSADGTGVSLHRTPPNQLGNDGKFWTAVTPRPGQPNRLGDTDLDGDVDTTDLTTAIINFTSAGGVGKTWSLGDTDGDGDIDTADLTTAIINFTSAMSHQETSGSGTVTLAMFDTEALVVVEGEMKNKNNLNVAMDGRHGEKGHVSDASETNVLSVQIGSSLFSSNRRRPDKVVLVDSVMKDILEWTS